GDFDALARAGQLKANAWEAVIYYKGVGCGNGHARLTYIEDNTAIGFAELDVRAGRRRGAHLKAAVERGMNRLIRHMAFSVGRDCFRFRRYVRSLRRLSPLRDFHQCCQLAARLRKCVKDVRDILRVELKLPSSKSEPDAVVDFILLAFGKIVPQARIECAVLVILSPLKNGLETTTGVLLQFLFLVFCRGTFGEHFRLTAR